MNKGRIAGLIVLALLAAGLVLRSCMREEPPPVADVPPPREVFHASKPLRVEVNTAAEPAGPAPWLEYELRHLLGRGQMRLAPVFPAKPEGAFTLRVNVSADAKQATFELVAPDGVIERQLNVPLADPARLGTMQALAAKLPQFLDAAPVGTDWIALIGTDDPKTYDTFVTSSMEILGREGQGFTQPATASHRTRTLEGLEALARTHKRFARARASLAAAYLSLGGQDESSLTQLAESSAQRALSLDDRLADAHAVLGVAHLRRNEWVAARERFDRALTIDASNAPALEGLACLLADAGRRADALPIAQHAVFVQPNNAGAQECLAYAAAGSKPAADASKAADAGPGAAGRVRALELILGGDIEAARQVLSSALSPQDFNLWAAPLLQAAGDRRRIPDALQAVTRAASDGAIDAGTEIFCGVALRQAQFVFNRVSRLQRQRTRVSLRIFWLPQSAFLRRHPRFKEVVVAAGLPAYWQEHGSADACASEPAVHGCKLAATAIAKSKE
jgi:tetratricopeptide (TPR) repeat protein